jgi:hypothetical protein
VPKKNKSKQNQAALWAARSPMIVQPAMLPKTAISEAARAGLEIWAHFGWIAASGRRAAA